MNEDGRCNIPELTDGVVKRSAFGLVGVLSSHKGFYWRPAAAAASASAPASSSTSSSKKTPKGSGPKSASLDLALGSATPHMSSATPHMSSMVRGLSLSSKKGSGSGAKKKSKIRFYKVMLNCLYIEQMVSTAEVRKNLFDGLTYDATYDLKGCADDKTLSFGGKRVKAV